MKNIKSLLLGSILSLIILSVFGQTEKPTIYNPEANAKVEIASAVKKAKAENKHVLLQVGGNW